MFFADLSDCLHCGGNTDSISKLLFSSLAGDPDFRVQSTAVWLPEEQNGGHCTKSHHLGWRAGRGTSHFTCRWAPRVCHVVLVLVMEKACCFLFFVSLRNLSDYFQTTPALMEPVRTNDKADYERFHMLPTDSASAQFYCMVNNQIYQPKSVWNNLFFFFLLRVSFLDYDLCCWTEPRFGNFWFSRGYIQVWKTLKRPGIFEKNSRPWKILDFCVFIKSWINHGIEQ